MTGISLFYANKGYHPRLQVQKNRELPSLLASSFIADLESIHTELKLSIKVVQERYQKPADAHRTPAPNIQIGNLVFILAKFIKTLRPLKKLSEKYLGPFEVIGKPSSLFYLIRLPDHLCSIHPLFHVSQLELSLPNTIPNCTNPPLPLITIDRNAEYEIARILDSKLDHWQKIPLLYYIQWAGYEGTPDEFSWLGANELENAQGLVMEFHTQNPNKPGPDNLPHQTPCN